MCLKKALLIALLFLSAGSLPAQLASSESPKLPGDTLKHAKILVAFYSRTGTTKQVAAELAAMLGADIEEITDTKNRRGFFGYLGGGRDASGKKTTVIGPLQKEPADYDLVVLATPVWAWTVTPAMRTYLIQTKGRIGKAAFLCTMGGSGDVKTFTAMEEVSGLKPSATVSFKTDEVKKGRHTRRLRDFADQLLKVNGIH
ncbi:MAG: flavodoxin [bacterium]|nr:flavodoxin [bacterium]